MTSSPQCTASVEFNRNSSSKQPRRATFRNLHRLKYTPLGTPLFCNRRLVRLRNPDPAEFHRRSKARRSLFRILAPRLGLASEPYLHFRRLPLSTSNGVLCTKISRKPSTSTSLSRLRVGPREVHEVYVPPLALAFPASRASSYENPRSIIGVGVSSPASSVRDADLIQALAETETEGSYMQIICRD